ATAALGGPAPYWHSWTFDSTGNRLTQTVHATGGDTTTNYAYPAAGSVRPHAVNTATTGGTTLTYGYDQGGNTACRPRAATANAGPSGTGSQSLNWTPEGRLGSLTDATGTSSYIYTADGVRLVGDTPTSTTLYLPGTELVRDKATGAVSSTRYFS